MRISGLVAAAAAAAVTLSAQGFDNGRRGEARRVAGETVRVYEPVEGWSYAHGVRLAKFGGRLHMMFTNCQKDEGQCGSRVLVADSADGVNWSEPRVLMPPQKGKHSSLALFAGGFIVDGGKLLAYVFAGEYPAAAMRGPDVRPVKDGFESRSSWMLVSEDGRSWGEPVKTPYWITRPCRTPSGKWIGMGPPYCPWTMTPADPKSWTRAPIDLETMRKGELVPKLITESYLLPSVPGLKTDRLRLLYRTELKHIWMSQSRDDGRSWSAPKPTKFRHDNSMFTFGTLPDGRIYAVGNPAGDHVRNPLVLMIAQDGEHFAEWWTVRDDDVKRRFDGLYKGGTFGYPETLVSDGFLYIAYSVNKEAIDVTRVPLKSLETVCHLDPQTEFVAPAVTGHVHASTLLPVKDGVLAAWFEGSKEGAPDVAVKVSRRTAPGVWKTPCVAVKVDPKLTQWNPVLRRRRDGQIELYFKLAKCPEEANCSVWKTYSCLSDDEGATWSAARELVPGDDTGGRGPVKNKCLRLADGRLLAPASCEIGPWRAFVDISDDDGRTWRKSANMPVPEGVKVAARDKAFGMIQPTLFEALDGSIVALVRTNGGKVWQSRSHDCGETWAETKPTSLDNINSGLDAVKASDGKVYLVLNGGSEGWGPRYKLDLFVSEDDGVNWQFLKNLVCDERRDASGRMKQSPDRWTEFSYPAILEVHPGVLGITYTWNRQRIAYLELSVKEKGREPVNMSE